jgi:hypothetical protein
VRQLLHRAFDVGPDEPFLDPAIMAWKYWDRRDDWKEPRAYVLERDGVIVAHAGICPMAFGGGEVRGVHMIDWASSKESPGSGLALLQKLVAMFDFVYSIGGSEMTRKILPAYGFVEYARVWRGARPLRPLQQILSHQYRNWKLPLRFVRNYLWTLPKASLGGLHQGWKAEEIDPSEVSGSFDSQDMANNCFSQRSSGYFEYLLRCPVMPMHLFGIIDRRETRGHFAIGVLQGQARVAGVWLREPGSEAWQAAFTLAQQTALQLEKASEIVAAGTDGLSEQAAIRSGLRILEHTPVYLYNKKKKLSLPPDFQFQLSDNDGLFMDSGRPSYLT